MGDCASPHESAEGAALCAIIDDDYEKARDIMTDWSDTELREFERAALSAAGEACHMRKART